MYRIKKVCECGVEFTYEREDVQTSKLTDSDYVACPYCYLKLSI